jgi:dihydrofolate synthase/folylpolyglutamate synthase
LSDESIHKGLQHVKKLTGLHGRWEIIHQSPLVVLDVAHNIDGIAQIVQQAEVTEHRQLHFIIGLVRDKEVEKIFSILPKTAKYYFTKAQIPRAISEDELAVHATVAGLNGESFSEVNDALNAALQHAHETDLILVCGSVFLIGEVRNPQTQKGRLHFT